jgi:hypothetical protein
MQVGTLMELQPLESIESSGWANVVAIDPGGTTGWSVMMVHPDALVEPDVPILANIEHWSHGQFSGSENKQTKQVMELLEAWPDAALVIEQFSLRVLRKDADLLSPVRITAKIELALEIWPGLGGIRNNTPVFYQPTSVLAAIHDGRLRQWGLYERAGGEVHARDADRHSLYFLRNCKGHRNAREIRQRAWPQLYDERWDEED